MRWFGFSRWFLQCLLLALGVHNDGGCGMVLTCLLAMVVYRRSRGACGGFLWGGCATDLAVTVAMLTQQQFSERRGVHHSPQINFTMKVTLVAPPQELPLSSPSGQWSYDSATSVGGDSLPSHLQFLFTLRRRGLPQELAPCTRSGP